MLDIILGDLELKIPLICFQNPDGIQGKNDLEIIEDILYHYTKNL